MRIDAFLNEIKVIEFSNKKNFFSLFFVRTKFKKLI